MGAEREDTDPNPKRVGTEPGLGVPPSARGSGPTAAAPAAPTAPTDDDPAAPVDFDALHAALGDPLAFDEKDDLLVEPENEEGGEGEERVGESSGRSSATYSSARPHTIPPTRAPVEDLNAPPVIVASEDTVPSAPPHMTAQMTAPLTAAQLAAGRPPPPGAPPVGALGSGPHPVAGHPGSGPHPNAPPPVAYPNTPPAFAADARAAQMTMRMPERPINPRRQRIETVVVRRRGPSARQKLLVFMAMLVLVTACGIAVTVWRNPRLFGLEPPGGGSATPSAVGPSGALAPTSTGVTNATTSAAGGVTTAPAPTFATAPSGPTSATAPRPKPAKAAGPTPVAAPTPVPTPFSTFSTPRQ